jgi:hypothetical protein
VNERLSQTQFESRDTYSGFIAYAPVGSIRKGEALVGCNESGASADQVNLAAEKPSPGSGAGASF